MAQKAKEEYVVGILFPTKTQTTMLVDGVNPMQVICSYNGNIGLTKNLIMEHFTRIHLYLLSEIAELIMKSGTKTTKMNTTITGQFGS